MTHINGIAATTATNIEALASLSSLEGVLAAVSEGHTTPADVNDLLLALELAARGVSMMSYDLFEAEVATELAVWTTRLARMPH